MRPAVGTLPGTGMACSPEARARLRRIPLAFLRRVTAVTVAEDARAEGLRFVDAAFFDRAASYRGCRA
jgi:hypothetical protein